MHKPVCIYMYAFKYNIELITELQIPNLYNESEVLKCYVILTHFISKDTYLFFLCECLVQDTLGS